MQETRVDLAELELTDVELGAVFGGQEDEFAPVDPGCEEMTEVAVVM